jgi:hypothetical protein
MLLAAGGETGDRRHLSSISRRVDPMWRAKHYIEMRTGRIPDPEKEFRRQRAIARAIRR